MNTELMTWGHIFRQAHDIFDQYLGFDPEVMDVVNRLVCDSEYSLLKQALAWSFSDLGDVDEGLWADEIQESLVVWEVGVIL